MKFPVEFGSRLELFESLTRSGSGGKSDLATRHRQRLLSAEARRRAARIQQLVDVAREDEDDYERLMAALMRPEDDERFVWLQSLLDDATTTTNNMDADTKWVSELLLLANSNQLDVSARATLKRIFKDKRAVIFGNKWDRDSGNKDNNDICYERN